ncbi:MAG: SurA N-terminal domain-containing protein [Alphaproteobacteria bacterium]|nr:SurA N-terminal domain-containing protein [Alphaproteobacteria bacterium]MBO5441913.1 SurA N-terminal domain-containing protein [Alphaproteobacteria bacterium]
MKKLWIILGLCVLALDVTAQEADISNLDREVRSSKSRSIMFRRPQNMEEQAARRAEAEERAREESRIKKEQAVFRPYNLFGKGLKIAATVNGEMVSNKDLQERANLFCLTTGMMINGKNKKLIADKVMQNVIDEKIKLQEAEKQNIRVSDKEIKEAYRNFEKSNGVPAGKFANVLKEYQVSQDVFMTQIRANLLWNKLVSHKMGQNVDVSIKEINDELERIKKDMNTPKYMVSEIVIKRKDGEHIDELVETLKNDPRFELYAAQFSQSASAPSGGRLGWVSAGQLAAPLDKAIRALKEGQISNAIAYRTDYYIFKMDKIYDPKKDKKEMPGEDEVRAFVKNRKTDELANKYIRDLRNRAVIEKKF